MVGLHLNYSLASLIAFVSHVLRIDKAVICARKSPFALLLLNLGFKLDI